MSRRVLESEAPTQPGKEDRAKNITRMILAAADQGIYSSELKLKLKLYRVSYFISTIAKKALPSLFRTWKEK